jgi:hypothetical protein
MDPDLPGNPPAVSPYVYEARDFAGNKIHLSVPYDNATKAINGSATLHRDPACMYTHAIIGPINQDGSLPPGTFTVPVPSGDSTFTVAQMAAIGLTDITQITATQITAAP